MIRRVPLVPALRGRLPVLLATAVLTALLAACAPAASPRSGSEGGTSFIGVGLALSPAADDGTGALVVGVLPDSPAARANVPVSQPPARIVAVDGADVRSLPLTTIVERTRGPLGSSVTLTLGLAGGATREVVLTRQRLTAPAPSGPSR